MTEPTRGPSRNGHSAKLDGNFRAQLLMSLALLSGLAVTGTASAQSLSGTALVTTLRQGGFVLLMRHASSPPTPPTAATAEPDNAESERQLDQIGRGSAIAMGEALKALTIPVGEVWSSPTYRARETVRLAKLPDPTLAVELGDGGQSMGGIAAGQTIWLRAKLAERPRSGTNTVIVTQYPNIQGALGQHATNLADGEALIVRPAATGDDEIAGRVKIDEWPALASQR
jgi:hypothetical protein